MPTPTISQPTRYAVRYTHREGATCYEFNGVGLAYPESPTDRRVKTWKTRAGARKHIDGLGESHRRYYPTAEIVEI